MAHVHDGISEDEAFLIESIARDQGISVDVREFRVLVEEWQGLPRDQRTLEAMAQAILDIRVVTEPAMLEGLLKGLKRVAQADGDLTAKEVAVYHGFVTAIMRRMHSTFTE